MGNSIPAQCLHPVCVVPIGDLMQVLSIMCCILGLCIRDLSLEGHIFA